LQRNLAKGECRGNQTSLICHDRAKLNALEEGQYRFLEWQKVTLAVFVEKNDLKLQKPIPADRLWAYFLEKALVKGARVP